jgi:hypothetical protein
MGLAATRQEVATDRRIGQEVATNRRIGIARQLGAARGLGVSSQQNYGTHGDFPFVGLQAKCAQALRLRLVPLQGGAGVWKGLGPPRVLALSQSSVAIDRRHTQKEPRRSGAPRIWPAALGQLLLARTGARRRTRRRALVCARLIGRRRASALRGLVSLTSRVRLIGRALSCR